jgi:hypothetical protein
VCHPAGDQFRGGVRDGEQNAVFPWEDPAPITEFGRHFIHGGFDVNRFMIGWQQDAMIEFADQALGCVAKSDEVEHVVIFIEGSRDFHGHSPVVPMQPLTDISVEGDEVGGTEDQVVLGDSDTISFFAHL